MVRVALLYGVSGWLILQVADVLFGLLTVPDWTLKFVLGLLILGFPVVLVFSWAYELTPDGLRRDHEVEPERSISDQTGSRITLATFVALAVAIGLLLYQQFGRQQPEALARQPVPTTPSPAPPADPAAPGPYQASVAVLPFVNMSADADNEYFSDGISEELLNVLVRIDGLRVPSRTSSFAFKGRNMPVGDIARDLNVDHILEGSVRKAGDQVRVTAQLIDVATDTHLWSETFTRKLDDIFAVQDEIATAIADALQVTLAGNLPMVQGTRNSEAYNLFLKGRYEWHKRTTESFAAAERNLKQAIALDPRFARAWAALADTYILQAEYKTRPMAGAVPDAREAAAKAIELDPDSARAVTADAYIRYLFDWDYESAEAGFRRAIELDPDYATARQWYGEMLAVMRRFDEALILFDQALALDPASPSANMVKANLFRSLGRFEEAEAQFRITLQLAPGWFNAQGNLAWVFLLQKTRIDEARELIRASFSQFDADPGYMLTAVDAYMGLVDTDTAVTAILESPIASCDVYDQPSLLALIGEYQLAMETIERCIDEGLDPYATHFHLLSVYRPAESLPLYQKLLKRVNLAQTLP